LSLRFPFFVFLRNLPILPLHRTNNIMLSLDPTINSAINTRRLHRPVSVCLSGSMEIKDSALLACSAEIAKITQDFIITCKQYLIETTEHRTFDRGASSVMIYINKVNRNLVLCIINPFVKSPEINSMSRNY